MMDITLFIFLSLIAFFFMIYGWERNGVSFVFLILSFLLFGILALNSFEITWNYPITFNDNATTYTVQQGSITYASLYALLSGLSFLMAIAKVAILAEESLDIKLPTFGKKS